MKIVFFSDVHGNQYAFQAFQDEMKDLRPDKVVFLGDVFGYYYGQEMILDGLRQSHYECLLGNHDHMFLDVLAGTRGMERLCERYGSSYRRSVGTISCENITFLQKLPTAWELRCDGLLIGAFHGSPEQPLEGRVYPDTILTYSQIYSRFDYIFLGHTHHKMMRELGSTWIINPGSIGQQRDGKGCSYALFDTETRNTEFKIITYPVDRLIAEVEEKDSGDVRLLEVLHRTR